MKKTNYYRIWGLGQWPLILSTGLQRKSSGLEQKSADAFSSPRYPIPDKDMGKIHKAASTGNVDKLQHALMLGKNCVNDKDKKNRAPLHFACAFGHPRVVTLLHEMGCDINICDNDNCTPLIKAVQCQEEECMDILLEHGADPNAVDASGHTALHYAIYSKNTSIAAKLLSHNANMEAENKDGLTPLLLAVLENKQQIAEFLVEKKANIHAVDKMKRTALMLAVRYKSTKIVKLLLQQGIDVFYKDANGQTASDHALAASCEINREMILEHEEKMLKISQNRKLAYTDLSSEADLAVTSVEGQRGLRGSKSGHLQDEEEWMKMEVSQNLWDGDNNENEKVEGEEDKEQEKVEEEEGEGDEDGNSIPRRIYGKAENQQFPLQGNKGHADNRQATFEHEGKKFKNSQESNQVDENSEDDSLTRVSNKTDLDDSWPASDEDIFTFNTKNEPKINLKELWEAFQKSRKIGLEEGGGEQGGGEGEKEEEKEEGGGEELSSPWDSESISQSLPQKCVGHLSRDKDEKHTINEYVEGPPEKYSQLKATVEMNGLFQNKATGLKDVQTFKSDWKSTVSTLSNKTCQRSDNLKGDGKYPLGSQPMVCSHQPFIEFPKTSLIESYVEISSEEGQKRLDVKENNKPNIPKENLTKPQKAAQQSKENETNTEMISEEGQNRLDVLGNNQLLVEERKKNKSNAMAVSRNVCAGPAAKEGAGSDDNGGMEQPRESENADNQQFPTRGGGGNDEPIKKTSKEKSKVKKQINVVDDLDDLTQPYDVGSEECELSQPNYESILLLIEQLRMKYKDSVSLSKILNAVHSYKMLIELKNSHHKQFKEKIDKMENTISELQKDLSETKYTKLQLEHEKGEQERELCKLRLELEQEKKKSTHWFYEKFKEELEEKEEQYDKVVEMKQQLEICLTNIHTELKTVKIQLNQVLEERNNIEKQFCQQQNARMVQDGVLEHPLCEQKEIEMTTNKVFVHHERENELLHKTHMLQDKITMLKLEIDTIKKQNQEKEKKYLQDINVIKIKNDDLLRTIKLNEEIFTKTIIQNNEQLSILTAENAMLNSKLENQRQGKKGLEAEVKSGHSQLPPALHDHGQNQTSRTDLGLAFQRAGDEWAHLQGNMNCNLSNKSDNNEILSQQLSKSEKKIDNLEIEVHHPRDELGEKTLVSEHVQKNLSQIQCEIKEIEYTYEIEQGQVNEYSGEQDCIEEETSHLPSENMLLRQQFYDAHYKDDTEEGIINIQDRLNHIMDKHQEEIINQRLTLEHINRELTKESNHLKARLRQYESEIAERKVRI